MGIMAREVETMQLTQLLGMMPQEVAPSVALAVTKGIVELSSVTNKAEIDAAIDQALAPPSPEAQARQKELEDMQFAAAKAELEASLLENQKTIAETRKLLNEALVAARKAGVEERKQDGEEARILLQLEELEESRLANQLDSRRLDLEERRVEIDEKMATKPQTSSS
jgi:multidrug efflux pump subunit AcrA (membrane-fusion protein)